MPQLPLLGGARPLHQAAFPLSVPGSTPKARPGFTTIDEYLASVPRESKIILEKIRRIARAKVPSAQEVISYQLPAFKLRRTFVYFAAFKKHIGMYPPVKADQSLMKALRPYAGEKGNLKFPLDQLMPYDLITRVVVALAKQYE